MNVYKQRVLNIARALRESPVPQDFTMSIEFHPYGTPACAWGHYVHRSDLQDTFKMTVPVCGYAQLVADPDRDCIVFYSPEVLHHFGISREEASVLFERYDGCGGATTPIEAAEYIEAFAAKKWPEPKRTDSELVSDLMAKVMGERIPEEA